MAKVTFSFTMDDQRDRRIVRWLEGLPKGDKSRAIRDALDAHLGGAGVTLSDLYQAVKDLDRKAGTGGFVLVQAGAMAAGRRLADEPPDVTANLDSLGL